MASEADSTFSLSSLADNELIVYVAYVAYLIPWTIVTSIPFINPVWRPVRDTRHDGFLQLVVVSIPVPYIIFYILVQNSSNDYKEMFAALIGLLLSAFHIVRTVSSLSQLRVFRRFASNSIHSLHAFGIPFTLNPAFLQAPDCDCSDPLACPKCVPPGQTPDQIADRIYVNNTIVGGSLLHGNSQVYIQYRNTKLRMSSNFFQGPLSFRVKLRLSLAFSYVKVFSRWLRDKLVLFFQQYCFLSHRHTHHHDRLLLMPQQPVELWLRWATAIVAQGLPDWITTFNVARNPQITFAIRQPDGTVGLSSTTTSDTERRDYFATEVFAAACLHLLHETRGISSPMLWDYWEANGVMANGRFSMSEVFNFAMDCGIGLPFGAPQRKQTGNNLDGVHPGMGYHQYRYKLARRLEHMPAGFGDELYSFGLDHLEWFSILLCLGAVSRERHRSRRQVQEAIRMARPLERDENTTMSSSDGSRTSGADSSSSTFLPGISARGGSMSTVQLQHLHLQLGFLGTIAMPEDERGATEAPERHVGELSAFPLLAASAGGPLLGNQKVCKASALIDIWLALVAGEQLCSSIQPNDANRFYYKLDSKGRIQVLCDEFGSSGSISCFSPTNTETQQSEQSLESIRVTRREFQSSLERARLEYHLTRSGKLSRPSDTHTLTFMGCSMEVVRRSLQLWVEDAGNPLNANWEPEIEFDPTDTLRSSTDSIFSCMLTQELSTELMKAGDMSFLSRRAIQVRLLWELQQALITEVVDERRGPNAVAVMLLCLLSFPSLNLKLEEGPEIATWAAGRAAHISSDFCALPMTSSTLLMMRGSPLKNKGASGCGVEGWRVTINPTYGLQRFAIELTFIPTRSNTLNVASCLKRESEDEDKLFLWELWRDGFEGRLEGMSQWQDRQSLPSVGVVRTTDGIGSVWGEGSCRKWGGWQPFRREFDVDEC